MSSWSKVLGVVLGPILLACGAPKGDGTSETGGSSETDETGETDETDETGDPVPDGHGSIRIEIVPLGGDVTMFDGTSEIVASANYENCLQDFYLVREPSYALDGVDGAPVFADWVDRLCSDDQGGPDCDVTDINQNLIEVNAVYTLGVTLQINDPSTIANREIHVGPIPLAELAACEGGEQPTVELRASGLIGKNAMGEQIWRISSLPANNSAVADQVAPLLVEVVPL
jgi:hypothetical protein